MKRSQITILLFITLLFISPFISGCVGERGRSGTMGAAGPVGPPGAGNMTMNLTANMTAGPIGPIGPQGPDTSATWNASYYLRDTSRTLTGNSIRRDVNNDYISYIGGTGGLPYGAMLALYGGANPAQAGGAIFSVGDAAGTGSSVAWSILGTTDDPELSMNANKIVSLKDPTAAQDAATKAYVDLVNATGGAFINNSYYLRDTSLPLTGEKVKRDVDNDLLTLYGGNAIAGGTGIISLYGSASANPNDVEVVAGDGGVGNNLITSWRGGTDPVMDMNGWNISNVKDPVANQDATTKKYVDDAITGGAAVWADYVPALAWGSGTPSGITTIARYIKVGKVVTFTIEIVSADSNGATGLTISLPEAPTNNANRIAVTSIQRVGGT